MCGGYFFMDKYKRYERLAAIVKIFSENPNTLINLEYFVNFFWYS